ncbi:unnamed protein product [Rodentolepis nana]|uniref:Coiled-coil domain-containing protein 172 n=1 Tax=Rodentolepis nana TaxID=102285 RepID=A0A0R3T589_RODNA|nr:unnamed protein product [Rodentolepis nana]
MLVNFKLKEMQTPELSFSFLTQAIEKHMKERSCLEARLKEIENKSSVAEKELKTVEKEHSEVKMQSAVLRERKQLLINKLQILNAKNDKLQKTFVQNQESERELEGKVTKCKAQMNSVRSQFNGEYLKLQNPIFTELSIPETKDFELPDIDIEALQVNYQAIQQSI